MFKAIAIFAGIMLWGTGTAFADTYQGIIAETYSGGQSLKLTQVDDLTKEETTYVVNLDEKTLLHGAKSAAELEAGMAVSLNASETSPNRLYAEKIEVL